MANHLQKIGRTGRLISLLVMIPTSVVLTAIVIVVTADMIRRHSWEINGKPLWLGVVFVLPVALASIWLTVRLWNDTRSPNGITMMPTWFIQLFGLFLLAGTLAAWILGGSPFLMIDAMAVTAGMILLPRAIRRMKREPLASESDSTAVESADSRHDES